MATKTQTKTETMQLKYGYMWVEETRESVTPAGEKVRVNIKKIAWDFSGSCLELNYAIQNSS